MLKIIALMEVVLKLAVRDRSQLLQVFAKEEIGVVDDKFREEVEEIRS